MRIGIFPEWFSDATPEIHARCSAALAYLTSRGATVVNITIPHLQIMSLAHSIKISTEFALGWDEHFYNHPDRYRKFFLFLHEMKCCPPFPHLSFVCA